LNSRYTLVRDELARYRSKKTGDSFLARFDGPAPAAIAILCWDSKQILGNFASRFL
jgi:hypothetical protein